VNLWEFVKFISEISQNLANMAYNSSFGIPFNMGIQR
jgi:hypothetical protein